MEPGKLSETRHLDIKIEYYMLRIASGVGDMTDTLVLMKYKILRQLMTIIQKMDMMASKSFDISELVSFGGMDGLRKNVEAVRTMMTIINTEEDRLKLNNSESDGLIIQFDKAMKVVNEHLKKA